MLEVNINREIRDYTETVFMGLSLRQFFFSLLAIATAAALYFLLTPHFNTETVSWMCVLGAAPFAVMGFFKYHGMTAEKFLIVWFRSEILEPKEIPMKRTNNIYYEAMKESIAQHEKELYLKNEDSKSFAKTG